MMIITAAVLAITSAVSSQPAVQHPPAATHRPVAAEAPLDQAQFHDAMRALWEDHVTWTRLYIVSAIAGLPDAQATAELVAAAKGGNSADVKAASKRWYDNANEIADFLSTANPKNWPQTTMRNEMRHHLDLTLEEAQARLRADWKADIAAYEKIHHHILGMADVLSKGIVSQFSSRFN